MVKRTWHECFPDLAFASFRQSLRVTTVRQLGPLLAVLESQTSLIASLVLRLERGPGLFWQAAARSRRRPIRRSAPAAARLEHMGGLRADRDAGRVGIAAQRGRHHGGVGDRQPVYPMHPQVRPDHAHRIAAEAAGSG